MKLFRYFKNFTNNIINFFEALLRIECIDWSHAVRRAERSLIDKSVVLEGNFDLLEMSIDFGSYLGKNSNVSYTSIGKFCSIGPNFLCGRGIHPTNGISTSPAFYSTKKQNRFTYSSQDKISERELIRIGNDVFIGSNVTVLDGVTIGDGAIIGAGAVVSKNIPPYAIAVGCPIKIIKYRFSAEIIDELLKVQWWNQNEEVFKSVEKNFFDVETFIDEMKAIQRNSY